MISDDDRSFRYGDGLFETVFVDDEGPVGLEDHLARFRASAHELGFPTRSITAGEGALLDLRGAPAGLWRVTVSRDDPDAPFGGSGCVRAVRREPPPRERPRLTLAANTYFPGDSLAEHKTTNWLRNIEVRRRARVAGFDDALRCSIDGFVGEASAANLILSLGDTLVTPAVDGILPGTTRARIVEALDVEERPVRIVELSEATSLYLTSAGLGVVAVDSLDGRVLQEGPLHELSRVARRS